MKKHDITLADVFRNIGIKKVIAAVLVMLLTIGIIAVGGYYLYSFKKDAISETGELSAIRSSKEVDSYLTINTNAIALAGYNIDRMLKNGNTHDEIFQYLVDETQHVIETIDKDNNGVYGWVDGEYMDTVDWGWQDDPTYIPKERPWYVEAIDNESDITYIEPYLDAQSGQVMMTISYRLSDHDSVIALDISLEKLQEVTESVAASITGNVGMILTDDGYVVAHSDISEREKEYANARTLNLGSTVYTHLTGEDNYQFELKYNNNNYIVYVVRLESGWNTVSVINADVIFRPLKIISGVVIGVALISIAVIFFILLKISTKNMIAENLNLQLRSIADIYVAMHDINLFDNTFRTISVGKDGEGSLGENYSNAQDALNASVNQLTDEMNRDSIITFVDLSTVSRRLASCNTISEEFLNTQNLWCRARFISAERTKNNDVKRVLWVIESIDAEKRRRDKLQYLSETDMMTGISNRGSGERKVSKLIDQGYGGMFIMLDADKFKSINDTFGHDVGDKVIIAIANCLKKTFRVDDVIMRLGGDEFAAYAVGVFNKDVGQPIIDRFFDHISRIEIPELGDRKICVSVGAAFYYDTDNYAFSQLYKNADSMTYVSKKTVGNCVSYYVEED